MLFFVIYNRFYVIEPFFIQITADKSLAVISSGMGIRACDADFRLHRKLTLQFLCLKQVIPEP